jgi:hypothetical protein
MDLGDCACSKESNRFLLNHVFCTTNYQTLVLQNKKENIKIYIHTYHSRFIPEGVAEVTQIFFRDTHVLSKLVSYQEHCRSDRWQAHRAVLLQSISGVSDINPLVAFYDIHGGKRELLFFYCVPDTAQKI